MQNLGRIHELFLIYREIFLETTKIRFLLIIHPLEWPVFFENSDYFEYLVHKLLHITDLRFLLKEGKNSYGNCIYIRKHLIKIRIGLNNKNHSHS